MINGVIKMSKKFITEKSTLEEVLKYDESLPILMKYGLPCLTCPIAKIEMRNLKIGEAARMYGINVEKLIKELNEAIRK